MNGSILPTLSRLLQDITSMTTLANDNTVAPSSWAMERSHLLSAPPVLTLQDWDAGSGLPSLVGQESPHASLAYTTPVTPPVSKPTVFKHSNVPTSSVRTTLAKPGWPSSMILSLPFLPGKQMVTTLFSWQI